MNNEIINKLIAYFEQIYLMYEKDKEAEANVNDLKSIIKSGKDFNFLLENIESLPLIDLNDEEKKQIIETKTFMDNASNFGISLTEEQINQIKNKTEFLQIKEKINFAIKKWHEISEYDLATFNSRNSCKEIIENLKKLEEGEIFDFNKIYYFLKSKNTSKVSFATKCEIHKLIFEYLNESITRTLNADNEINILQTLSKYSITKEEAIELFEEYNYDYSKVASELQDKILLYGNIDEMRNCFKFFQENKIDFSEKNDKLVNILYRTKEETIKKIIEFSETNKLPINEIINSTPSIFINMSKKHIMSSEPTLGGDSTPTLSGSYEDFEKNYQLLLDLNIDASKAYHDCSSFFTASNSTIMRNIECLKEYGIDLRKIDAKNIKLTALLSTSMLFTIDQFIELGEKEYCINYPSRLRFPPDSYLFYRIYFAKKNNIPIYSKLNYKDGYCLSSEIGVLKNDTLDINEKNKYQRTNTKKHVITIPSFDNYLNDFILNQKSIPILPSTYENPLIKSLDANYKQDDYSYIIGNKIISRHKVIRLFALLEDKFSDEEQLLLYIVTYNSILDDEEFENIRQAINDLKMKVGR